ncbi:MAG: hypothetical protein HKN23_14660 [Verrucomicrobiales bacterium]|nr:hypothetical protein [Verrucomicrobiales bacterium]
MFGKLYTKTAESAKGDSAIYVGENPGEMTLPKLRQPVYQLDLITPGS